MTITHHLDDATLMSFAAGSLANTLSAVAAAHISMCGRCRGELGALERIGAALVADVPAVAMTRGVPAMPTLEAVEPAQHRAGHRADQAEVPEPLVQLLGASLDTLRWRWIGIGLWHHPLKVRGAGGLQLIKAAPGASVPEHTHAGSELTLVLRGALIDDAGRYGPGDVADLDEAVEHHTPSADPSMGCICVIANEQPTRFHGLLARLMQPWHGL